MASVQLNLSPKARQAFAAARIAIYNDAFKGIFEKALQNASFPAAAAMAVFSLINRAQSETGPLSEEELYKDEGVVDAILAALFKWAENEGYEEATDEDTYIQALDLVDEMWRNQAQGGGGRGMMNGMAPPMEKEWQMPEPGLAQEPGMMM